MTNIKEPGSVTITVEREGKVYTYHISRARLEMMRAAKAARDSYPKPSPPLPSMPQIHPKGSEFGLPSLKERDINADKADN